MRAVVLGQIQPDMKLGKTLYASDGRVLLHRGTQLEEKYVDHLKSLGFEALYIEDPNLPDLEARELVAQRTRMEAVSAVKDAFTTFKHSRGQKFNQDWTGRRALYNASNSIITDIVSCKDIMIQVMELRGQDEFAFAHSVNVCIMGMALARRMGLPHGKMVDLAIGLLLHDIGILLLPEALRDPGRKLEGEEAIAYRSHAQGGYDLLKDMRETFGATSKIVTLQHHEWWDGSGYPRGLHGDEIHEFAQICGIVDVYDRLTNSSRFGRRALPHEALEYLMGTGGRQFRLELVRGFLEIVAPYPLGMTVQLNNGEHGVVVEIEKGLPQRPVLRMYNGLRLSDDTLKLSERPDLVIVGVPDSMSTMAEPV